MVDRLEETGILPESDPAPGNAVADAGIDVGDGGTGADTDAGAPTDTGADAGASPVHPGAEGDSEPAPPLPADIVASSELPFHGVVDGEVISSDEVQLRLADRLAICLGELHDNPFHHNLQRRVLESLAELERANPAERGELAVGYEMFQRPFQQPLSAYVAGELEEAAFLEQTEYAQRWGADLALYRPLYEANREQGLAALALNAPTELTRQIGREGLESLTPELQAQLPELDLEDAEHREFVFSLFGLSPDDPGAASLENIYRAQVTWDETMAQTATEWLESEDGRRVLAFAGVAHCHESAIPRRVERRSGIDMLSVAPVLASELAAFPDDYVGYELLIVLED
ncbi:MAG TPA: ChaN family lipoprotein [Polyangiaceae bacterium]|nr:ChaN family lipoprotein [Polyangiaceae bacterium]